MAALTATRDTPKMQGGAYPQILSYKVKAGAVIKGGGIVVLDATGYALKASAAAALKAVGVAVKDVDNTGGVDGAVEVEVFQGVFKFANKGGDLVTQALVGAACYIEDDQTVRLTAAGTSAAGWVVKLDSTGVWVRILAP